MPKKDTAPKSESVSIATKERPAIIPGLAAGINILEKINLAEKKGLSLIPIVNDKNQVIDVYEVSGKFTEKKLGIFLLLLHKDLLNGVNNSWNGVQEKFNK